MHRRTDPRFLAEALWPVSDADAQKRIATSLIKDGARRGLEAFTEAASALRAAVTTRLLKGEVSTLVSAQIPVDLTHDCAACQARHISGLLFQQVGLAAGVQVDTEGRNTYLSPLPKDVRPTTVPTRAKRTPEALLRYIETVAPVSTAHLAAMVGTSQAVVATLMPGGLIQVTGPEGNGGWVPEAALPRLREAEPPRLVRLLPPSDPWLQARDRELMVPDEARRKAIWGAIGNPGVLLVDGEAVGIWRAKVQRKRLVVTIDGFRSGPARLRVEIEHEAGLLTSSRGQDDAAVEFI